VLLTAGLSVAPARTAPAENDRDALRKDVQKLYSQTQAFRELFEKTAEFVTPGVVSITTTRTVTVRTMPDTPEWPFPFGNPFENAPNQPFQRRRPQQPPKQREIPQYGLGSGFVVDAKNGWIITNAHVVQEVEAKDIKVVFADGHDAQAKAVFSDPRSDIAVVQVDPDGLVELRWGNDEEIKPGEWVMAVGSPMGFGNSITSGIISAPSTKSRYFAGGRVNTWRARAEEDPFAVEDYIQTDAAINPGNSGGPLVTLDGHVIGINTLIVSGSMSNAGLGFAVPVRIAKPVVEQLIEKGKVVRGYLGVSITNPSDITDEGAKEEFDAESAKDLFERYKISADDNGAFVAKVIKNGPADKAGIQVGDLLVAVAGRRIRNVDSLREEIASIRPGTTIDVRLTREGREERVEVVIGEQPEKAPEEEWVQAPGGEGITSTKLGISVQTLTPDLAEALGYDANLKGVIIAGVEKDGPTDASGLKRNDIILQVGQDEVKDVAEFQVAVNKMSDRGVAFLVRRGDAQRFVTVKPAE
jgi:serine protease Do